MINHSFQNDYSFQSRLILTFSCHFIRFDCVCILELVKKRKKKKKQSIDYSSQPW